MMAKASGPDAALVVSIVAAAFAGLAALFAGWSAWTSHRSAGSAASAARSAAEAVELERDRRHRELTPRIELTYEGSLGGEDEGVWFANTGRLDYTSVAFNFATSPDDTPIAGLALGGTYGGVGPLAVGERTFLALKRHSGEREADGGTLHLILTCSNDQGTWTISAKVEIPGVPSAPGIF
jgi:type II secretory pathway pseudopilin PulG